MMRREVWGESNGKPELSVWIVDDIRDSGETLRGWEKQGYSTWVLVDKVREGIPEDTFILFPWEVLSEDFERRTKNNENV